jgi:hypothetical protein
MVSSTAKLRKTTGFCTTVTDPGPCTYLHPGLDSNFLSESGGGTTGFTDTPEFHGAFGEFMELIDLQASPDEHRLHFNLMARVSIHSILTFRQCLQCLDPVRSRWH